MKFNSRTTWANLLARTCLFTQYYAVSLRSHISSMKIEKQAKNEGKNFDEKFDLHRNMGEFHSQVPRTCACLHKIMQFHYTVIKIEKQTKSFPK